MRLFVLFLCTIFIEYTTLYSAVFHCWFHIPYTSVFFKQYTTLHCIFFTNSLFPTQYLFNFTSSKLSTVSWLFHLFLYFNEICKLFNNNHISAILHLTSTGISRLLPQKYHPKYHGCILLKTVVLFH